MEMSAVMSLRSPKTDGVLVMWHGYGAGFAAWAADYDCYGLVVAKLRPLSGQFRTDGILD